MRRRASRIVFVTVGTTKFDALIKAVTSKEALEAFNEQGFSHMMLQIGAGQEPVISSSSSSSSSSSKEPPSPLDIAWYRYKDSLRADVESANLVISHAGAGSIMEALDLGKHLIVVVNTALMDDHQQELAHAMEEKKYLLATDPSGLVQTLQSAQLDRLLPRPKPTFGLLPRVIDEEMGFASTAREE